MAGSNNFLQWNPGAANQEPDAAYSSDGQRNAGAPLNGILPSALANKLYYQLSTFVAAFAQMMANKGFNMSDVDINTLAATLAAIQTTADGRQPQQQLAYTPSPVFNIAAYSSFLMQLDGDINSPTIIGAPFAGQVIRFLFFQNGGGGHQVNAWPGQLHGGPSIDTTPGAMTVIEFIARTDGNFSLMNAAISTPL